MLAEDRPSYRGFPYLEANMTCADGVVDERGEGGHFDISVGAMRQRLPSLQAALRGRGSSLWSAEVGWTVNMCFWYPNGAEVYQGECAPPIPEPQGSYQSVIIGVLALLVIIFLLLLLAYFWKRKRERSNWYSQMPAPTSLMNEQGEMLSPAEDLLDQEITEEEFLDDIEDDSFQPVSQPTLVMMSGVGPSTGGGTNMPC